MLWRYLFIRINLQFKLILTYGSVLLFVRKRQETLSFINNPIMENLWNKGQRKKEEKQNINSISCGNLFSPKVLRTHEIEIRIIWIKFLLSDELNGTPLNIV